MKCTILHETRGRMRVRLCCRRMTLEQADVLEYYLRAVDGVQSVKVYDRTRDAVVVYAGRRSELIRVLDVQLRLWHKILIIILRNGAITSSSV